MMNGKQLKNSILQLAIQGKLVPPACRLAGKTLTTNLLPTEETGIWYVYVIECEDGSFYKGFTTNLQKRYKEHCSGHGAEWTKKHKPKQLYYYEIQYSEEAALKREKYLKSGSGREWFKREVVDKPLEWEPASALLQRIRKEKEQLVKEGKLKKKDLVTTPISDEEKPFELPKGWEWCRLGEILSKLTDGSHNPPPNSGTGYPVISAMNIKNGEISFENVQRFVSDSDFQKENARTNITQGDIIMGIIGGSIGNVAIYNHKTKVIAQRSIAIMKSMISLHYTVRFLQSYLCQNQLTGNSSGSAQGGVYLGSLSKVVLPLPPLSEQHRIVAKIEELMPLVEEYDKAQTKLDDLNRKLPEALKKSILQEAIMGKLVASSLPAGRQDPNDEPASVLLQRIHKEKEQLVKEGKLKKKDLVTTPITDEEKPFEIPESWEWCRLGEICSFLSRGKSPKYSDVPNLYPVFAQKCNLKNGGISLEQARFLNPDTIDKWQETYKLKTGDILVNSTGTGTVCRTRLFHENYLGHYPFTVPDSHVSVVRTFEGISSDFYYYIFNSKHIQDYWEERLAGSTNQKELYIGTLQNTLIPLPPLSEQHRIVAKIEELFGVLG